MKRWASISLVSLLLLSCTEKETDAPSVVDPDSCRPSEAFGDGTLVLPPAQFFVDSGVSYPVPELGMNGDYKPLTGFFSVKFSGDGRPLSLYLESENPLSGTYSIADDGVLTPCSGKVSGHLCLDCSFAAASLQDDFRMALPEGSYAGVRLRLCMEDGKFGEYGLGDIDIIKGQVTEISLEYSPDPSLLWSEHFDRMVWGTEPFGTDAGYGPSPRAVAPASMTGHEPAWFIKTTDTPGTVFFSAGAEVLVNPDYLARRGSGFWTRSVCCRERPGCLELGCSGSDAATFDFTGVVPGGSLHDAVLSFRIATGEGFSAGIVLDRIAGAVRCVKIDGVEADIAVTASPGILNVVKQSSDFLEHQTVRLGADALPSGQWHEVEISIASLCGTSPFILEMDGAAEGDTAFLDDIVLRADGRVLPEPETPTDELAGEGEDCSGIRLMTGAVTGISQLRFGWAAEYGMEYIDPTLASTTIFTVEDFTDASGKLQKGHGYYIDMAASLLKETGGKVWCVHMPYLDNLCLAHSDESLRRRSVERFISYMEAVSVLQPVNVLFHAGANSEDSSAYSSDALVRSLVELQPYADGIGAHICIENVWKGVGSDPAELADIVDRANSTGHPAKATRIAFDSGHALLWSRLNGGTPCSFLRTLGTRVGTLHISSNHGTNDDHVFPGYGCADSYGAETATWSELMEPYWGELYGILLGECRYRGPWVYEVGTKNFDDASQGPKRFYTLGTPWFWTFNHDSYIYPKYRKYLEENGRN